jgi:hypothetical protein
VECHWEGVLELYAKLPEAGPESYLLPISCAARSQCHSLQIQTIIPRRG